MFLVMYFELMFSSKIYPPSLPGFSFLSPGEGKLTVKNSLQVPLNRGSEMTRSHLTYCMFYLCGWKFNPWLSFLWLSWIPHCLNAVTSGLLSLLSLAWPQTCMLLRHDMHVHGFFSSCRCVFHQRHVGTTLLNQTGTCWTQIMWFCEKQLRKKFSQNSAPGLN